ncbi:MAG: SixA phosphatase family protein [Allosphingosinicella sp.]
MKTLTLLRHAKSSWNAPAPSDFERPLNKRGRRAARTIGRELRAQDLKFDAVLASPAVRVVQTLEEFGEGYGDAIVPRLDDRIYLASAATLLKLVQDADDAAGRLLVVGHNPGLESLALLLTREQGDGPRQELAAKYPTATVAEIEFDVDQWRDVGADSGRLTRFIRPRDLDPELGPEPE